MVAMGHYSLWLSESYTRACIAQITMICLVIELFEIKLLYSSIITFSVLTVYNILEKYKLSVIFWKFDLFLDNSSITQYNVILRRTVVACYCEWLLIHTKHGFSNIFPYSLLQRPKLGLRVTVTLATLGVLWIRCGFCKLLKNI